MEHSWPHQISGLYFLADERSPAVEQTQRHEISPVMMRELASSFVRITRPHHEALFRIALSICRDRDQAADLTQEALIRAFKSFHRFDRKRPVLPWLARILKNVHLDSFKTGRSKHEVASHQMANPGADPFAGVPCRAPDPAVRAETAQLAQLVQRELQALEPDQQLVVILCDIEGFTYQEAAKAAGVPVGTVRSRLARARQRIRQGVEAQIAAIKRGGE